MRRLAAEVSHLVSQNNIGLAENKTTSLSPSDMINI